MSRKYRVFTTCPQSTDIPREQFVTQVGAVARWSEEAGCAGILIYADNRLVDPWLVAQLVVQATERLCPLVAVQPIYMHPYSVAKMVATLGHCYGRKTFLNMIAGGFKRDLEALGDPTEHDERYARLEEYTRIATGLVLASVQQTPFSFSGRLYSVQGVKLTPPLPAGIEPEVFVSGSSAAGRATAAALGAVPIHYPERAGTYAEAVGNGSHGIRLGLVARPKRDDAWAEAELRFPPDRRGEVAHQLAMKVSDSQWHKALGDEAEAGQDPDDPYWLRPFRTYRTFCPYLVGSFERLAEEVARYMRVGFDTFILDIPPNRAELEASGEVFARAAALTR